MRYDAEDSDKPIVAIILAISDIANVRPTELDPLHGIVNTEVLDHLFAANDDGVSNIEGQVEFSIDDYKVTVNSDGGIRIQPGSGDEQRSS